MTEPRDRDRSASKLPVFDDLPVGLFRASRDGVLCSANQALASILGCEHTTDLTGSNLNDFLEGGVLGEVLGRLGDGSRQLRGAELALRRIDGTPTLVRANIRLSEEDGTEYLEGALDDLSAFYGVRDEASASQRLLQATERAHLLFSLGAGQDELFGGLIRELMELTSCTVGFIVMTTSGGSGRVLATAGVSPAIALQRLAAASAGDGPDLEMDPDSERGYREIPIHRGEKLVGLIGLGGRSDGVVDLPIVNLEPVLAACSTLIYAHRADTRRREVESELQWNETVNRTVLETAASGIITTDSDGLIRTFNRAAARLFGYSPEEVIGQSITILMAPDDAAEHDGYLSRHVMSGVPRVIGTGRETLARHRDGTLFPIHLAVSGYRVDGQRYFAGVIADMRTRKAAEAELADAKDAAERATRAKTAFLASMSHEIRTPMNGILGMASMLEDTDLSSQQQQYLGVIRSSAEALLGIINDILDFSKVEAGRIELEPITFEPRALVEDCLALVGPEADKKDLSLGIEVAPDVPDAVVGDAGRIRQILLNLLANAIKFTEEGSVTVEIDGTALGDEVTLMLRVVDTGIGIPAEKLKVLFNAFAQADASTSRRYGGTGLGLTISRQLAHLMDGEIDVESRMGLGTTFTFRVPLQRGSTESLEIETPRVRKPPPQIDGARVRILLAEDTITNQRVIAAMLSKYGFRIEVAGNGIEAVEAVKSRPFDLVLMDVRMPEMDGIEATRRIRELDVKQPRIAAMTADVIQETMDLCFEAGMDDFLTKPIRVQEVLDVIGVAVADRGEASEEDAPGCLSYSSLSGLAEILELDDPELLEELVDTYLTDLTEGIREIAEGADREDAGAVMDVAHKLKSSSRLMGAAGLGDRAEVMEMDAREGRLPAVEAFEEFVAEARRVTTAMRGMLPQVIAG